MSKISKLLIVFALMLSTFVTCEAAKKTVAVMPLENVSGYTEQQVAEIMTEQLIAAINGSGNYVVVERTQMGTVLREQGFQSITGASEKSAEIAGADYSVLGKVMIAEVSNTAAGELTKKLFGQKSHTVLMHQYRGRVSLNFRLVNTATGEILFDQTVEGEKTGKTREGAIHDACKVTAENALKEIQQYNPFSARIVEISGDVIYIDAGFDSGLKNGETLVVAREVKPIEVDGKIVGMTHKEIGRAKITEINSEYSICKITSHSDTIRKGDLVKRGQ